MINAQHCMRAYCTPYHPIFKRASWLPGSAVSLWSTHPHVLLSPWKSHPLEGSCQEAIPLLYTTFDIFFRCVPIGTLHPRLVISDASVFSLLWRRLPLRRTSHPSGSRLLDVSCSCQTSAPGTIRAPENPRFPAASNRVHLTDVMAPSRVQLFQGSRQRRR